MKLLRFITVCAAVSLVAATAGFAQHVQTDFDHQANFGQYKTYSWQEIKPGASLWDSRIKNAVNAQLEAKGLEQVADGGDIAIVAIKTSQTQRTLQTFTTASVAVGDGAGLAASASQPQPSRITKRARWSSTYTTGRRSS
jgi:Domain of unknown function (DUF4136)